VNWEAVLQKRVTPPVKPLTLEFLDDDPEAPGDADECGSDISFETANEGTVLEGRAHDPQTVKCPTMDQETNGPTHEPQPVKCPTMDQGRSGPAHEPQTVKCPTVDEGKSGKMKKLMTVAAAAAAVVAVSGFFVFLENVL
jgi:hypothetical protein